MKRKPKVTSKIQFMGFTVIELIVVTLIISVLAAAALPMAETAVKREREIELHRNLRIIRTAIDEYKKFVDKHRIEVDEETYGYPSTLEDLVKGIEYRDKKSRDRIEKFLRKIPWDPINKTYEWGLRSYQDKRDSRHWGGENVWDIFCQTEKKALNGTYYKDW